MSKRYKEPASPEAWQEAVNLAECFLRIVSARQYGLVTGGPTVNVERCADLIKQGAQRGIRPQEAAITTIAQAMAADGEHAETRSKT